MNRPSTKGEQHMTAMRKPTAKKAAVKVKPMAAKAMKKVATHKGNGKAGRKG